MSGNVRPEKITSAPADHPGPDFDGATGLFSPPARQVLPLARIRQVGPGPERCAMAENADCPSRDELEMLLLGTLAAGRVADLEAHLLACDRCAAALRSMPAEDGFVRQVRAGAAAAEAPPLAAADLIA